jgi:hypothetical protein
MIRNDHSIANEAWPIPYLLLKKNKEFFIRGRRKILGSYSVNQKEVTRVALISERAIPALGIGPRECLIFQIHLWSTTPPLHLAFRDYDLYPTYNDTIRIPVAKLWVEAVNLHPRSIGMSHTILGERVEEWVDC